MNPGLVLVRILVWGSRIGSVIAIVYGTWVFMVEALKGTQFHIATALGVWAMVGALAAIHLSLWLIERAMGWTEEAAEGGRVAKLLSNSHAAGHRYVTVTALVDLWFDVQPENRRVRFAIGNYRLRTIKDAIDQGLLRADLMGDSFPSGRSRVEMVSAIEFFKKRRWLQVKPRQSGEVYSDEKN